MAKPFVFVLMPFDSAFDDTYKLGIKAAAEEVGTYCERVDEQYFEERILERIYNQIATADFIIADMSGRNPNVFYETGYAHALNKKVILLVSNSDDIPFDLKHHPHIVYNGKITFLKEELKKRLAFFISNPIVVVAPALDGLEFSINGSKLVSDVEINLDSSHHHFKPAVLIQIDVHNTLDTLFSSGFEIALESSIYLYYNRHETNEFAPIVITEKRVLHRGGRIEKILPSSYTNKSFLLCPKDENRYTLEFTKYPFILRVSNEIKSYKIPFTINISDAKEFKF